MDKEVFIDMALLCVISRGCWMSPLDSPSARHRVNAQANSDDITKPSAWIVDEQELQRPPWTIGESTSRGENFITMCVQCSSVANALRLHARRRSRSWICQSVSLSSGGRWRARGGGKSSYHRSGASITERSDVLGSGPLPKRLTAQEAHCGAAPLLPQCCFPKWSAAFSHIRPYWGPPVSFINRHPCPRGPSSTPRRGL
jgi:hypothetical protein